MVPSQDSRNDLVAADTSSCPQIALTTAIPAAPAHRTRGTRSGVIPPIATQGQGLAATIARSPSTPAGAAASGLVVCHHTGPAPR
jgi:hypothetical protein